MAAGIFVTFGRRYGPPSGQPALPYLAATGLAEELHVKKLLLYAAPWPQSTAIGGYHNSFTTQAGNTVWFATEASDRVGIINTLLTAHHLRRGLHSAKQPCCQ